MTEAAPALSGIIPIPVTTFSDDGKLDLGGIRSQVDFCHDAGAHAVLYPGVVSEFYVLTGHERRMAVEACVEAAAGRIPVIVGVSAPSTPEAVDLARHAASLDVDAVMTMTPFVQHFFPPTPTDAQRHVLAVAEAADSPVILQNARIGHPVPVPALEALVRAVPQVRYVKQETNPSTQAISDVLGAVGDRITGVFGGLGGVYLVNELERGALGSMPAPAFVDGIVEAYSLYRTQGAGAAQGRLDPLGTLFTRELLYNVIFIKEVLRRRGVIKGTTTRIASPTLDAIDLDEVDRLLRVVGLA